MAPVSAAQLPPAGSSGQALAVLAGVAGAALIAAAAAWAGRRPAAQPASRHEHARASPPAARGPAMPLVAAMLGLLAIAATACTTTQPQRGTASQQQPHGGTASHSPAASRPPPIPDRRRLLVPDRGVLFGAWVQPSGSYDANGEESAIAAFERALGRKLAINQLYLPWAAPMPLDVARWDLRHGMIPMISWGGTSTSLIASGAYDAQIRARARQLRDLHGPVMLRWFAEMDGRANRANAVSPASFIAAWRHIHRIFLRAGAGNVRWVWCPTADFTTGSPQLFYPGAAYVDWIGADGYNWAPRKPHAPWRGFAQIFSGFYQWGRASGKPLLIGEYGVLEQKPGQKAAWFAQADRELKSMFPAIRAVVYFNSDHLGYDWRVTTSRSSLVAFRAFARDPYFMARPAG
jgi:hypothetical protein